jgi:molybdopterin converting factor small subunit
VVIEIQYFAQLRGLEGPDSLELPEGATVEDLLKKLFQLKPTLKVWDKHLLVAAQTEWVQRDYVVKPGDTISLMPPVQGG